jgi:polyhydroxybutyrate depolymerase
LKRFLALLSLALLPGAASACPGPDAPCEIATGQYFAILPEGEVKGAVLFLHGYRSNARATLRMSTLVEDVTARGYALVAVDGSNADGVDGGSWAFAPMVAAQRERDDDAFLAEVADDAAERFVLPRDRLLLAGFSEGGFMTTYLACRSPDLFAAFASASGGFWRPMPKSCAGPVRLFHTHGWRDEVVPLEGRWLRAGVIAQGDIFAGLGLFREANGCTDFKPDRMSVDGPFMRRGWDCAPGSSLEFALFDGGHQVPHGWAELVLDWFEALP